MKIWLNIYQTTERHLGRKEAVIAKLQNSPEKRNAVHVFINKLKARESHYGRNKSVRHYLPSELCSIRNLWRMYEKQAVERVKVKYEYFKKVFLSDLNLAIGTPRTDVCSVCLELGERFKLAATDEEKQTIRRQKRVHSLRSQAFYRIIGEAKNNPETLSFTFDCMQNQVLPKVPDQSAFYSRQLYFNIIGVVQQTPDGKLLKENSFSYTWTEDLGAKGSSEITNAIYHRITNSSFDGKSKLVLICGGQNKNSTMITMAAYWLANESSPQIKEVMLLYPVTGHSFLPSDRCFGVHGNAIKKLETITKPQQYNDTVSSTTTVLSREENEWKIFDWKGLADSTCRKPLPCKIQSCKRIILTKIVTARQRNIRIRGEPNYRHDLSEEVTFCKRVHC